jgi:site-specific recombinase XerD
MIDIGQLLDRWAFSIKGENTNTKRLRICAVRSLFTFMLKRKRIPYNPAKNLEIPAAQEAEVEQYMSVEEVLSLIKTCKRERLRILIQLLYVSGMRITEALTLKACDFIFFKNDKGDFYQVKIMGKGRKIRKNKLDLVTGKLCIDLSNGGFVFHSSSGQPISYKVMYYELKEHMKDQGFKKKGLGYHVFRHCNASHSAHAGADLETIRRSLGHTSFNITKTYFHGTDDIGTSDFIKVC